MDLNEKYITIVNTEDTIYHEWQKKILFESWKDQGHLGDFVNIQSCKKDAKYNEFTFIDGMKTFICKSNPYYGEKNDYYSPYNKPLSIKAFLEKIPKVDDRNILIVDPDCLFINNLNYLLNSDKCSGDYICYMDHSLWKTVILNFLKKENIISENILIEDLEPIGVPILIKEKYLRAIVDRWLLMTLKLRSDQISPLYLEWIAEMWALCCALGEIKLKLEKTKTSFTPFKSINTNIFLPPKKNLEGCSIFHYCLDIEENGKIIFNKRNWQKTIPDQIIFDESKHSEQNVNFLKTFNKYLRKINNLSQKSDSNR